MGARKARVIQAPKLVNGSQPLPTIEIEPEVQKDILEAYQQVVLVREKYELYVRGVASGLKVPKGFVLLRKPTGEFCFGPLPQAAPAQVP